MDISEDNAETIEKTSANSQKGRTSRSKSYPLVKGREKFLLPTIDLSKGLQEAESRASVDSTESNEDSKRRKRLLRKFSSGFSVTAFLKRQRNNSHQLQRKHASDWMLLKTRLSSITGVNKSQTGNDHNHKKKLLNPVRLQSEARKVFLLLVLCCYGFSEKDSQQQKLLKYSLKCCIIVDNYIFYSSSFNRVIFVVNETVDACKI